MFTIVCPEYLTHPNQSHLFYSIVSFAEVMPVIYNMRHINKLLLRYRTMIKQTTQSHIYGHPKKNYVHIHASPESTDQLLIFSPKQCMGLRRNTLKQIKEALTTLCAQTGEFVNVYSALKINKRKTHYPNGDISQKLLMHS